LETRTRDSIPRTIELILVQMELKSSGTYEREEIVVSREVFRDLGSERGSSRERVEVA